MSIGSGSSLNWVMERRLSQLSEYESRDTAADSTSRSEFAFIVGPDQISVSTIVDKLVTERLKLGIVKSIKVADPLVRTASVTEPEVEESVSSEETIPSLTVCLDKFEEKMYRIQKEMILDGSEPEEDPPNVIEPKFTESEEETDVDYKNPEKDIQMLLNRTRSFYTPKGFKDSRPDLKRLETERERMWFQMGKDKYTMLLYEEAMKPLHHIRIKGRIYDEDDSDLNISRDDIVIKSLESIMDFIKPIEMPPEQWDPGSLATEKHAPYWAYAPAASADRTINIIRHIYKTLRDTDFHRQDPKMRRRTGRKIHRATEESEESEDSYMSSSKEESSEDEPYMLKRKESLFLKKKVVEVVEEEEETQSLEIREGRFNLQTGHELSISNLQKLFPDSPEQSSHDSGSEEPEAESGVSAKSRYETKKNDSELSVATISSKVSSKIAVMSSWASFDDLDKSTSEESFYDVRKSPGEKSQPSVKKPAMIMSRGFPTIRQRPKWITLKRECLEKEGHDNSFVERYRCLCLNRGIPPLETVARNLRKTSAIFNRMGRGPGDTLQTLVEVLGKGTKTVDLTGVYMSKNDVCHLAKTVRTLAMLEKLRLPRTQLTGERLVILIQNLFNCLELCLLDVSYNKIQKITPPMTKALTKVPLLCTLNLRHCQLANDSFTGLTHLPPTLHSLDISWNRLNETSGLRALTTSFSKKQSEIRELRLGWNAIAGADAAKVLADMARTLKQLKFFDISYNGFSSPDETIYFNLMLMDAKKLKCFLLSGNPLTLAASEALLKDLEWPQRPALRLIDLGDIWVQKEVFQMCKMYKEKYDVETRLGRVKGNVDMVALDMSDILLKRLHFLNTSKKKKKTLKDFGNIISKMMEDEGTTKVKAGKFKAFMMEQNFKVEEGLIEAIAKALSDRGRNIDLEAARLKYRTLYPEEVKEPKKKKPKKKAMEEEEPIIELMEPRLEKVKSRTNTFFVKASGAQSAFKR